MNHQPHPLAACAESSAPDAESPSLAAPSGVAIQARVVEAEERLQATEGGQMV